MKATPRSAPNVALPSTVPLLAALLLGILVAGTAFWFPLIIQSYSLVMFNELLFSLACL